MAAQMKGNGRFRGSEDDKYEFWANLTRLDDLLASSHKVDEQLRESLGEAIKRNRELLDRKRIPFLTRKSWLRQLRREVERAEQSGLDNAAAQSLSEILGRIQEKAEKYRDE